MTTTGSICLPRLIAVIGTIALFAIATGPSRAAKSQGGGKSSASYVRAGSLGIIGGYDATPFSVAEASGTQSVESSPVPTKTVGIQYVPSGSDTGSARIRRQRFNWTIQYYCHTSVTNGLDLPDGGLPFAHAAFGSNITGVQAAAATDSSASFVTINLGTFGSISVATTGPADTADNVFHELEDPVTDITDSETTVSATKEHKVTFTALCTASTNSGWFSTAAAIAKVFAWANSSTDSPPQFTVKQAWNFVPQP